MAFGPGDEESRNVVRADVVEVSGDAKRFGRLLSADSCRIQPPADENQRAHNQNRQQAYEATSSEVAQP
jgi:hypothetical protein